jgi:2-polyprenyl-3-methyl-5-hydroxy-6-metoxy-1,4-benzoquinol methylase
LTSPDIWLEQRLATLPAFSRVVELIGASNPLQRKRVRAMLRDRDDAYFAFAEDVSRSLATAFMRTTEEARQAAEAYDDLCLEMLREQIRFRKTGVYRLDDAADANDTVYSDPARMRAYLIGLLLTYLFWPNHYALFLLFRDGVGRLQPRRSLEVGAGHGVFTAELLRRHPGVDLTVVDISQSSIEVTREFLDAFDVPREAVTFLLADFMGPDLALGSFDLIVLGEIIEHVNDAGALLRRAAELLTPGGTIFLTTCANCPAADHIYYFGSAEDIRDLVSASGLAVARELVLPAEVVPEDRWQAEKTTVNYGALLRRTSAPRSEAPAANE